MGTAFGRRCIPPGGVAPSSHTPGMLGRRALPGGRLAALGAAPPFLRWVLAYSWNTDFYRGGRGARRAMRFHLSSEHPRWLNLCSRQEPNRNGEGTINSTPEQIRRVTKAAGVFVVSERRPGVRIPVRYQSILRLATRVNGVARHGRAELQRSIGWIHQAFSFVDVARIFHDREKQRASHSIYSGPNQQDPL